jgi:choline dehydrogenase-like flavoprotein
VTHWPAALAAGVELRTNARVTRVDTDETGKATGVYYLDQAGGEHYQPASVVVVSGNGIGTPRLLLMSASERHPNGLANSSDQVGRNLMHHTLGFVEMWVDELTESHMGAVATPIICSEFAETDVSRGFVNGITLHFVRQPGAGFQALGGFSGHRMPWGAKHHDWFKQHFGHGLTILVYGDDLPQQENRITLSETETDSFGLPAAKLDYKLCENDRRLSQWGLDRAVDVAKSLGAWDIKVNNLRDAAGTYRPSAWHLLGTARMGDAPQTSVVNKWHQAWDCPNLFIIDGSVMVTGGAINPTSTISALSYRAAETLAARFEEAAEGKSLIG